MCGRFTQTASPEVIAESFQIQDPPLFKTRSNIAPSQSVEEKPMFRGAFNKRQCLVMADGFYEWGPCTRHERITIYR